MKKGIGKESIVKSHAGFMRFTMIELMVVISIIAILASLLLPALTAAKEKAGQAACSAALRQVGMGVVQYTIDSNDYAPMKYYFDAGTGSDLYTTWIRWNRMSYSTTAYPVAELLVENGYLTSKAMECPAAQRARSRLVVPPNTWCLDASRYRKTPADGMTVVFSTYLIKPTSLDNSYASMVLNPANWGYRLRNPGQTLACDFLVTNLFSHTQGINVLFEDGSVSWLPGVPSKVAVAYLAYPLFNGDARFGFFKLIGRGGAWNKN